MARDLLVAEPDPLQRQLIDMLLAEDDYVITWTATGKETLERLKETTPDLVMLKLALPDVTGAEICEKMKRVSRLENVPVVLVAEGEEGRPVDASVRTLSDAVGADLLLQKPLGDKNLRTRLHGLVEAGSGRGGSRGSPTPPRRVKRREIDSAVEDLKTRARLETVERENAHLQERVAELEAEISDLRRQLDTAVENARQTAERAFQERLSALEQRNAELEAGADTTARRKKRRGGLFNWRSSED